ncbi:hypothetical protein [Nocardiopsis composta]|uniref:Uncharacterized protein n=1 Tax=Nocardiopsis composta TaxID=157465 RepID=A0A7W8VGC2_9ACTN|nr:hypothetical protein [Nocardiopsis composta]MBB5435327.1 hypothetical protein [Nocardiopsis composta]
MPTFNDPQADAREAAEALRGLAHATAAIEDPRVMYEVIGNLLASTRYLAQVTDQLAQNHHRSAARATTDHGDPLAARTLISDTIDALRTASARMDQAEVSLDQASGKAGQIAWRPDDPQHRWVSIVFLQGEDADPVMEIIDRQGTDAAIAHLAGWDHGEETVSDAMEHGYVYDTAPQSAADRLATSGDYALTYSLDLNYVGLSRRIDAPNPEAPASGTTIPPLPEPAPRRGRHGGTARSGGASSWFRPDAIDEVAEDRGLFR